MKKVFSKIQTSMQTKIMIIITVLCVVSLFSSGVLAVLYFNKASEPEINSTVISERLSKINELATAKYEYREISHYEEGKIKFIDKKSFNMLYDAVVKAGVDLSKAEITVNESQIIIKLPEAEIFNIEINPDTVEFYDEKYALFNWTDKSDVIEMIKYAKSDIEKKVIETGLLDKAEDNAETLIKSILIPLTEESGKSKEIVFK